MRLHENKELFADAIQAASRGIDDGGLGIRDIFIEKDYWICRSLRLMALADTNGQAVHKGGTSLSKAYGIGARFSEDIDIAILDADADESYELLAALKRRLWRLLKADRPLSFPPHCTNALARSECPTTKGLHCRSHT